MKFEINSDGVVNKYHIIRKLAPTKCYLYKDGEDITRDTIQNTTAYIQTLLNTTSEVFQNCVIMTVNNATPFMAKKKLEKRKFIEGIFNLQVFSNMLTDVRQEYNSVSKDLDVECARYEEVSNTLNSQQEQKANAEQDRERSVQKLKTRLENCNNEIKTIDVELEKVVDIDVDGISKTIEEIDDVLPKLDLKIQNIISKKSELTTMIAMLTTKQNKISSEHSVCPTCLHELDDTHRDLIADEKNKLNKQIQNLNQQKVNVDVKLGEVKKVKEQLSSKKTKQREKLQQAQIESHNKRNLKQQKDQIKSQIKDIKDDIKSIDNNTTGFDKIIEETTTRLEQSQQVIDKIKKEMAKLEIIKFIVSEEGVKSYIVKKILQLFNAKLSYYLKKMDSNCICVFNEYFEDEIIDEKGKPCSYFNFSGAERKNIDLACLFAFMDIRRLQGDVAFNFSMYDELFDSSLDERGVELVIDILNERVENYNECAIVISHRKESTKLASGEVIFLEKQNGVTTRVETPETELK